MQQKEWPVALQLLANLNAGGLRGASARFRSALSLARACLLLLGTGTVVTAGAAISACAAHGAWEEALLQPRAQELTSCRRLLAPDP